MNAYEIVDNNKLLYYLIFVVMQMTLHTYVYHVFNCLFPKFILTLFARGASIDL